MVDTLNKIIAFYNEYGNHTLVQRLEYEFLQHKDLQDIRGYFEEHYGFAQNSWLPYWQAIFRSCNIENFLDVGVNSGQFSLLSKYLGKKFNKGVNVWSISPFTGVGDKYSTYEEKDYLKVFEFACDHFGMSIKDFNIIKGLSQDQEVKNQVKSVGYDLIYLDGSHDYEIVKQDIQYYVFELLKSGGIVIFDDCNSYIPFGGTLAHKQGYPDVERAVSELMDDNDEYELLFKITHNKIFRRK